VARRAGLSKVTLFRYFDTKEALFEAVMQRHIASATLALQSSPMQDNEAWAPSCCAWPRPWT
jgi:AcrR family transcriptional regulator